MGQIRRDGTEAGNGEAGTKALVYNLKEFKLGGSGLCLDYK